MIRHAEPVMGTVASFALRPGTLSEGAARRALAAACASLHEADAVFSTYRPESPMSRVRARELSVAQAPAELAEVLALCRAARRVTDGWFDPWALPCGLDPTGLVKGWAAQRALAVLRTAGIDAAMVNAGGDVAAYGAPRPASMWRIAITDPLDVERVAWTVGLDGAIATSGAYERGVHVLNPHTATPASCSLSASVLGADLATADALATALLAGGAPVAECIAELEGYDAIWMNATGEWQATGGLRDRLSPCATAVAP